LSILARIEDSLLVILLALMILSSTGQILSRNIFNVGLLDADPFARLMVLWVAMLGAVVAARSDKHINIDVLSRMLSPVARRRVKVLVHLLSVTVCLVIAVTAFQFVVDEYAVGVRAFGPVPAWLAQSVIPLGFGLITLHYLLLAVLEWRGER
jgi:TRAP-type C4-dicarboxylate transport system permease small subunit